MRFRCLLGHDPEIVPITNRPRSKTGKPFLGIPGTKCRRCGKTLQEVRFPGVPQ